MESRREKAYSFSYCLFAYIYKDIHERTKLPYIVDYTVPSTKLFKSEVGDSVLNVCRVHETFLNPVFSKVFPSICTSEGYFFEYVRWYYEKVACAFSDEYHNLYVKDFIENVAGPFFIKFLTLCSFIAALVRYCFNRRCYRFTSSAPTSLAEIVLKIPEITDYFSSLTNTFIVLNQFCFTVMNDDAINANTLCDLFMQQSDILRENCSLSLLKNYLHGEFLNLPASSKISAVAAVSRLIDTSLELFSHKESSFPKPAISHHRQSSKRKSNALNDRDIPGDAMCVSDSQTVNNPVSVTDSERCRKLSNAKSFPDCVIIYDPNHPESSESPTGERCPHCGKVCDTYLVEFVDDFKITNYEDED